MLKCCRIFGHTRDYWWRALTWALFCDVEAHLAEQPPVDHLVAMYFAAQKWWSPPGGGRTPFASDEEDAGPWECPFPDITE